MPERTPVPQSCPAPPLPLPREEKQARAGGARLGGAEESRGAESLTLPCPPAGKQGFQGARAWPKSGFWTRGVGPSWGVCTDGPQRGALCAGTPRPSRALAGGRWAAWSRCPAAGPGCPLAPAAWQTAEQVPRLEGGEVRNSTGGPGRALGPPWPRRVPGSPAPAPGSATRGTDPPPPETLSKATAPWACFLERSVPFSG